MAGLMVFAQFRSDISMRRVLIPPVKLENAMNQKLM